MTGRAPRKSPGGILGRISDRILHPVLATAVLAASAVLLALAVASFAETGAVILHYPFDLDYGEGIVWQQARDVLAGRAYAPLGVFPALVYHYPPVYHLAAGLLARAAGLDELLSGRLVSLGATVAAALLVGVLTHDALRPAEARLVRLGCAVMAGLVCFVLAPVMQFAPMMRVDMLAGTLGVAGLVLAVRALERPGLIHAASLAFVLAVFTKQVSLAAPAAAFLVLCRVRPVLAWRLLGGCLALGTLGLAAALALAGEGFVRHLFLYNVNRLDWRNAGLLADLAADQAPLLVVAAFGDPGVWRRLRAAWGSGRAASRADLGLLVAAAFLALKLPMLAMVLKSGAAANYFIEWSFALAVFAGLGLRPAFALARGGAAPGGWRAALLAVVLVALPLQAAMVPHWTLSSATAAAMAETLAPVVAAIAASDRPVVADDMTLILRAGRPVQWEPAIAAELAHAGLYDEAGMVALIRADAFGFFVTEGVRGKRLFDQRYNPPVADAIDARYPVKVRVGTLTLHLPADASAPSGFSPRAGR